MAFQPEGSSYATSLQGWTSFFDVEATDPSHVDHTEDHLSGPRQGLFCTSPITYLPNVPEDEVLVAIPAAQTYHQGEPEALANNSYDGFNLTSSTNHPDPLFDFNPPQDFIDFGGYKLEDYFVIDDEPSGSEVDEEVTAAAAELAQPVYITTDLPDLPDLSDFPEGSFLDPAFDMDAELDFDNFFAGPDQCFNMEPSFTTGANTSLDFLQEHAVQPTQNNTFDDFFLPEMGHNYADNMGVGVHDAMPCGFAVDPQSTVFTQATTANGSFAPSDEDQLFSALVQFNESTNFSMFDAPATNGYVLLEQPVDPGHAICLASNVPSYATTHPPPVPVEQPQARLNPSSFPVGRSSATREIVAARRRKLATERKRMWRQNPQNRAREIRGVKMRQWLKRYRKTLSEEAGNDVSGGPETRRDVDHMKLDPPADTGRRVLRPRPDPPVSYAPASTRRNNRSPRIIDASTANVDAARAGPRCDRERDVYRISSGGSTMGYFHNIFHQKAFAPDGITPLRRSERIHVSQASG